MAPIVGIVASSILGHLTPLAPTIGTATDGGTGSSATVAYTAAGSGPAATSFTATSSPGGFTGTGSSPITVSGLTAGTAYTFTVHATNAYGNSPESAASNSVTPANPSSFYSIATLSLSGVTTATFSSIPQTYKSLHLRFNTKTTAGNNNNVFMRLNGDSTGGNYRNHSLFGDGTSVTAQGGINLSAIVLGVTAGGAMNPAITDIIDYTSTSNNKTVRSFVGMDDNGGGGGPYVGYWSGAWYSTSAVTSLVIVSGSGSNYWTTGSTVSLYGVK